MTQEKKDKTIDPVLIIISIYDKIVDEYTQKVADLHHLAEEEKFLQNIPKYGIILDLGCGSGRDTKIFQARVISLFDKKSCQLGSMQGKKSKIKLLKMIFIKIIKNKLKILLKTFLYYRD